MFSDMSGCSHGGWGPYTSDDTLQQALFYPLSDPGLHIPTLEGQMRNLPPPRLTTAGGGTGRGGGGFCLKRFGANFFLLKSTSSKKLTFDTVFVRTT